MEADTGEMQPQTKEGRLLQGGKDKELDSLPHPPEGMQLYLDFCPIGPTLDFSSPQP